jgi:glycosyltransferase involved in cell wall biosynthesis
MKILFIIPSYKPAYIYGGTVVVSSLLAESLVKQGNDVTVYTTTANGKTELNVEAGKEKIVDGVKVIYFKRLTKDHSHISLALWQKTFRTASHFDVVHLHSWWNPCIVIAAALCKLRGVKPVLSPHGMFCNYVLYTNNKNKKKLLHFFTRSILHNTFLHVSTQMEWNESQVMLREYWQGTILPNLVQLNEASANERHINDLFTIGFISRVNPKKGLDILIQALLKVNFNYTLKIAGDGEESYISYLKELSISCGNSEKIDWVGWKNNNEKFKFYSSIDLLALTSLNENFAVVVIESLAVGTPVLLSDKVGLSKYVEENDFGWITSLEVNKVTSALNILYRDNEKQISIQQRAPMKIRNDYNTETLTERYVEFYRKIINKRSKSKSQVFIKTDRELSYVKKL